MCGGAASRELGLSVMRAQHGQRPQPIQGARDISIHQALPRGQAPAKAPVKSRLDPDRDARNTLMNTYRRGQKQEQGEGSRCPHPHHGGCYDSAEDRSPNPDAPGPRVFTLRIHNVAFPQRY